MSLAGLCRRVNEFGFNLLEKEFAFDARVHVVRQLTRTRSSLSWARDDRDGPLIIGDPARIVDYMSLLEKNEYSILMHDAAIVQLSYNFERDSIVWRRLVYYPRPLSVDTTLMKRFDASLSDVIKEFYLDDAENSVVLKTPIRFDYAPEAASESHPASHVTLNTNTCRIPVRSPMRFDQFIGFIIEHFYPLLCSDQSIVGELLADFDNECLSERDRNRIHLNWRNV